MRRAWPILLIALAAVVVAVVLTKRPGPPDTDTPPDAPQGAALLRILDLDERPVVGAEVGLYSVSRYRVDAEAVASAISDAGGWVVLPETDAGGLVLVVKCEGHGAEAIPLEEAGPTIVLSPGRPVRGLVTDLRGRPLVGARVMSPNTPPFAFSGVTDEEGAFELGPLADDAHVRAEATGFAPLDLSLSLYPLDDREFVFYLAREQPLAGRVIDTAGAGVAGALVELDQEVRSRVAADSEGRFVMPGALPDWEVLLTPRAAGFVGPTVAALAGQVDVELVLYRPAEVGGKVIDGRTGWPVEDYEVLSHDAERAEGEATFRIGGLPPGEVTIEVKSGSLLGEVTLDLREGETRRDATIPLFAPRWSDPQDYRPAYPVTIRVREEESGEPIPGALVRPERGRQETRTGRDGVATIRVPPGRHVFRVGGLLEKHGPREVEVTVPEQEEAEARLTRNPMAVVALIGGTARPGTKLWVWAGDEIAEHRISGTEVSFPANPDSPLEIALRAKGYRGVFLREKVLLPDGRIEIELEKGPSIRGRCVGEGGHPMAKVVVEIEEDPANLRMETPGDGIFEVGPTDPGKAHILIYARNVRTRRLEVVVPVEGLDLGDIFVPAPVDLDILVVDSRHDPVAGALVETSYLMAAQGITDRAGRIKLPGTEDTDLLRARADGFLDTWHEVELKPGKERQEVLIRLVRPARILLRVVGRDRRPAPILVPDREDIVIRPGAPGEVVLDRLAPGPFEIVIEDREGRRGTFRTTVREGEVRVETLVLE